MASRYKNGSLKRVSRKNGKAWVLRVIGIDPRSGKKIERTPLFVGYVCDLPTKSAARERAQELKLFEKINKPEACGRATFGFIARHWLDHELLNPTVVEPKAHTTVYCYKHIVDDYLLPRWESAIAEQVEPLDVEEWLHSLSVDRKRVGEDKGLEWETLSKMRNVMVLIYAHAQRTKLIDPDLKYNPVRPRELGGARCKSGSDYEAIILKPDQTFAILMSLPVLQQTMVVLDAATGIRASEIAGLQWCDIDWEQHQIHIRRTWIRGKIGRPKSKKSKAPVPMAPLLADYLRVWYKETCYTKPDNWVFASSKTKGRTPRVSNMLVADYLYPAAVKAGVLTAKEITVKDRREQEVVRRIYFDENGRQVTRFGFHNFRHSLSSFLTTKKKTDPKTAQRMLRQSNSAFTLNRYTQTDMDELVAAQEMMLEAIFGQQAGETGAPN